MLGKRRRSVAADVEALVCLVFLIGADPLLARATRRISRQDLGWAFGYNLPLVPLAAAGILPRVLAAVAMAASSVTVVGNALRLRRFGKASGHRGRPPRHRRATPTAQPPAGIRAGR